VAEGFAIFGALMRLSLLSHHGVLQQFFELSLVVGCLVISRLHCHELLPLFDLVQSLVPAQGGQGSTVLHALLTGLGWSLQSVLTALL
jgi:hypothetical protein